MKTAILMALTVLVGCASSTSEVMPYGKGAYIVSASGDTTWSGATAGDMRMLSVKAANEFCAKQGKTMSPVNSSEREVTGAVSSSLVFTCQ
jgi:hypothetical protein